MEGQLRRDVKYTMTGCVLADAFGLTCIVRGLSAVSREKEKRRTELTFHILEALNNFNRFLFITLSKYYARGRCFPCVSRKHGLVVTRSVRAREVLNDGISFG